MEKNISLTPIHCIFYIYHVFSLNSDGDLSQKEKKIIGGFMYRWVSKDKKKMIQIISETLSWAKSNVKDVNGQISTMLSMVDFLKTQKEFDINKREYFLMDIRALARSDQDFTNQQKKWHDMLASILGVELRISRSSIEDIDGETKKVERRKIGFRR